MRNTKAGTRFKSILEEYKTKYDVDALEHPNDKANLDTLINNQIVIEQIQDRMQELTEENVSQNIMEIQKLNTALRDIIDRNIELEKTLGIDRKSRQKENQQSVTQYIAMLKIHAREFLESQYIRVECPHCKIMVGRISPVHKHTAFDIRFQCSQCQKFIKAHRKERDVFFDVLDADWRRKYPVEIIQPRTRGIAPENTTSPDLIIGGNDIEEGELE